MTLSRGRKRPDTSSLRRCAPDADVPIARRSGAFKSRAGRGDGQARERSTLSRAARGRGVFTLFHTLPRSSRRQERKKKQRRRVSPARSSRRPCVGPFSGNTASPPPPGGAGKEIAVRGMPRDADSRQEQARRAPRAPDVGSGSVHAEGRPRRIEGSFRSEARPGKGNAYASREAAHPTVCPLSRPADKKFRPEKHGAKARADNIARRLIGKRARSISLGNLQIEAPGEAPRIHLYPVRRRRAAQKFREGRSMRQTPESKDEGATEPLRWDSIEGAGAFPERDSFIPENFREENR